MNWEFEMKCEKCKYWIRLEIWQKREGECRRFPPRLFSLMARDHKEALHPDAWIMPITGEEDWCGEWQQINLPDGSRE
jgi:hypothetical protein